MPQTNEQERLDAVHKYLQLDFNKSDEFQEIVNLAGELCEKPVAMITLLDEDVNWLKVRLNVAEENSPREISFCQYTVQQDGVLIINDATKDERFTNNPLVYENPNVRFYAGAPLTIKGGLRLGTLCLFDLQPNTLTDIQKKTLSTLSRQVTTLMELELSYQMLQQHMEEIEAQNESLRKIAHMQSHDIRQPLTSIMGLMETIKHDGYKADKETLQMMEEATTALDNKVHDIVEQTGVHK